MEGNIPWTQRLEFLKGISQAGTLQLKETQGQQSGVLCVTRIIRGRKQCFGVVIVRPVCVLRAASRLTHTKLNY
jgi:hypothetical protein